MTRAAVRIEKLVGGGSGLAHHDGRTWFVRGALPGELVRAERTGERRGVVFARAVAVEADPHAAREAAPCPHAGRCGGCDWPHLAVPAGTALKAAVAAEAAGRDPELAARLGSAPVLPSPLGYRLRARLHWDPDARTLGFYAVRSWRVAAIGGCRILSPALTKRLAGLEAALAATCPQPVDLEWLEDLAGAAAVAALRPARSGPPAVDPAWVPGPGALADPVDGFHALTRSGRVVAGWGATAVTMRLPRPLRVPVGAFFQGNRHLVPELFARVSRLAGGDAIPTWDLHGGVGFLAAAAVHAAPRPVVLTEPFRPAARAAAANLPEARVFVGRTAEAYLARHARLPGEVLVLTDPPRAGLDPVLRHRLAGWHPRRILMLACDPSTWARDARFLLDHGYRLTHLELLDLFPSTHHVEVLALLEAR